MSNVFILGNLGGDITKTFYNRCLNAGHRVKIFDDIDHVLDDLDDPLPSSDLPDFVIISYHGWINYANLKAFFHHIVGEANIEEPPFSILLSCTSTTGYGTTFDTPFLDANWLKKLVVFSALAFYQSRYVVELAPTLATTPEVMADIHGFLGTLNINRYETGDTPGLVLPRVLAMLVNEAASAVMEGVASAEDIDTAMRLGTNYPEGPLKWADKVGVDVICQILDTLYTEYQEDRYRPVLLLKQMAGAGKLGMKTGQGFYTYSR